MSVRDAVPQLLARKRPDVRGSGGSLPSTDALCEVVRNFQCGLESRLGKYAVQCVLHLIVVLAMAIPWEDYLA